MTGIRVRLTAGVSLLRLWTRAGIVTLTLFLSVERSLGVIRFSLLLPSQPRGFDSHAVPFILLSPYRCCRTGESVPRLETYNLGNSNDFLTGSPRNQEQHVRIHSVRFKLDFTHWVSHCGLSPSVNADSGYRAGSQDIRRRPSL